MRDRARSYELSLSLEAIWADLRVAKLLDDLRVSRRGGHGFGLLGYGSVGSGGGQSPG